MAEKSKENLDKGTLGSTLLRSTVQWFWCFPKHKLFTAKFVTNGFDTYSLSFIFSYLTEIEQETKIQHSYSTYVYIAWKVPQDLLFFNMNICEMFFEKYECDLSVMEMIIQLTHPTQIYTVSHSSQKAFQRVSSHCLWKIM